MKMTFMQCGKLQATKFLDGLLNRFVFLYVSVHGMLLKIQRLGEGKDFLSFGTGHDDYAIVIGTDNVARLDLYAITDQGDVGAPEAVMMNRRGGHDA